MGGSPHSPIPRTITEPGATRHAAGSGPPVTPTRLREPHLYQRYARSPETHGSPSSTWCPPASSPSARSSAPSISPCTTPPPSKGQRRSLRVGELGTLLLRRRSRGAPSLTLRPLPE